MRIFHLLRRGSPSVIAFAFTLAVLPCTKSYAATDFSEIRTIFGNSNNGVEMPGRVLRFELVRQDLTLTVNGVTLDPSAVPEYANGYIGFKRVDDSIFFADGSLPALETELPAVQDALRQDKHIHITAIANRAILESPKLIWVHFEATENGVDLAESLVKALETIHSPQLDLRVIPGTNTVFNPNLLPPKFLKLFDEGFVEQLDLIFAFYLPRPDEHRLSVGPVRAKTGLGIGQSFYIQIPIEGGSNNATLNIDFALRADEIQPVCDVLRAGGFAISAQSNQFVNDYPHLYFIHASASGDGFSLGNTLYDVIQIIQEKSRQNHDHDWDND